MFLKSKRLIAAVEKLIMSTQALEAAVAQLKADVGTLISNQANTVPQSAVDAVTSEVTTLDAQVQAVINPPAPAAPVVQPPAA